MCKKNLQHYGTDILPNEFREPQQGMRVDDPGEQVKCKGLGCDFFASQEYGDYCSTCFLETTKEIL